MSMETAEKFINVVQVFAKVESEVNRSPQHVTEMGTTRRTSTLP